MNNIINQLSQIEEKTVAILDGAADKKKTLAAEYEAKTKQFDEELNHETELEIQSMRQKMEQKPPRSLTGRKPPPVTRSPAWNSITKKSIPGMWTPSSVL